VKESLVQFESNGPTTRYAALDSRAHGRQGPVKNVSLVQMIPNSITSLKLLNSFPCPMLPTLTMRSNRVTAGNVTPAASNFNLPCPISYNLALRSVNTTCVQEQLAFDNQAESDGELGWNAYRPSCDDLGKYTPRQCVAGSV
jgi:hypothetical protein